MNKEEVLKKGGQILSGEFPVESITSIDEMEKESIESESECECTCYDMGEAVSKNTISELFLK